MSIKESALRLILRAKDALSAPLKKSSASVEELRGAAQALKKQLSTLESQQKSLSGFKKQTEAVRTANVAYRESKKKVEQLASAYKKTDAPSKAMQRQLANARTAVESANQEYQKQRDKLARLRSGLHEAGLSNKDFAAQQNRVEKEIRETSAAFAAAEKKSKSAARQFRRSGLKDVGRDANIATGNVSNLGRRLAALAGATVGIYSIKRAIEGLLSTGSTFESLAVQMEAVTGSAEEGERAMEWIKEFTANTPYQLNEVAEAFTRLKAFGLDPMDGTMQAIVDQASKLGGGMERLNGISLALGQAWAKQKLQGEEILQLVERGVPVWDLLQKATGKNVQELQKLSAAGALGRDVMAQLITEIGNSAEGAAAKNMSLLAGYVSNLKDRWTAFVNEIAQSGALDYAKEQLKALLDTIAQMQEDGRLKALAQRISDVFIGMVEAIKATFSTLTLDDVVEKIGNAFSGIVSSISALNKVFSVTGQTISFFFNSFTLVVKGAASAILYTFSEIISGWSKLVDLLGADEMAASMNKSVDTLRTLGSAFAKETVSDANEAKEALTGIYATLASKTKSALKTIEESSKKTSTEIKTDGEENQNTLKKTGDAMTSVATASGESSNVIEKSSKRTREAITKTNEAVSESAEETRQTTATLGGGLAAIYNGITEKLHNLSAAAHNAFVGGGLKALDTTGAEGNLKTLRADLEKTQEQVRALSNTKTSGWLGSWLRSIQLDSAKITEAFLTQKIALEELLLGYDSGAIKTRDFITQAQYASRNMDLLNDSDLEYLTDSINAAEESMAQLRDSSQSTLDGLMDELDQLKGREDEIEKRRFERQQTDIKKQLVDAEASGDARAIGNLRNALSVSSKVYNEKRLIEQNNKATALLEPDKRQPLSVQNTNPPAPQKTIRLESAAGSVNLTINSRDEKKLLDALKSAGMRTV